VESTFISTNKKVVVREWSLFKRECSYHSSYHFDKYFVLGILLKVVRWLLIA